MKASFLDNLHIFSFVIRKPAWNIESSMGPTLDIASGFIIPSVLQPRMEKRDNYEYIQGMLSEKVVLPFPKPQILDSSKLKTVCRRQFQIHENGRKFLKRVENTVVKGEIACYEQFLLSLQCFQKT